MSVILDALRRRRRESPAESSARGVPAGLGLDSAASAVSRGHNHRFKLIGLATLVGLLGVWIAVRFNSGSAVSESPAPAPVVVAQQSPPVVSAVTEPTPGSGPRDQGSDLPERRPMPERRPNTRSVSRVATNSRAQLAEQRTPNPESRTPNPESRIPDPGPRIPDPEPQIDHFALALRYQNLGDFSRAREHYMAVLADDEFNVEAHNNLALLYHGRGMTSEAVDHLHRAIQINPRYIKARSNLAVVLTGAGRLAEARAELRTALDIDPRNVDLLVNLALVEKADHHPEQAVELLLRAVGKSPGHAAAHYNLAVLYEARESLALAFDHYTSFLKYAGPEHGTLLGEVQRRLSLIEPRLRGATN